MQEMTTRAYQEIIVSGRYSYKAFIRLFDDEIERLRLKPLQTKFISAYVGVADYRTETSFSVVVATQTLKQVKTYHFAQSAMTLPSPHFFNGMEFVDVVPTTQVYSSAELRRVAGLAPAKVLLRAIAVKMWLQIPLPLRAVLKVLLRPVKKAISKS